MTRKHFKSIAERLHRIKPLAKSDAPESQTWIQCVHAVADLCAETNERFNYQQFFQACEKGL